MGKSSRIPLSPPNWPRLFRAICELLEDFENFDDLYRRVCLVEFYQNPPRKVQTIFWNRDHPYRGSSRSAFYDLDEVYPIIPRIYNFDQKQTKLNFYYYMYTYYMY